MHTDMAMSLSRHVQADRIGAGAATAGRAALGKGEGAGRVGGINLASVDLNLLVALEALLQQRNVTYAGQSVGLSQPAMSRALARLRDMFNDELLVRTSTGLAPTARGEQLLAKLPPTMGSIREILASRGFRPEDTKSKIAVAMPEHQALVLLPRLLPRLRSRAPNLDIVVNPLLAGTLKASRERRDRSRPRPGRRHAAGILPAHAVHRPVRLPAAPRPSLAAAGLDGGAVPARSAMP